MVLKLNKTICFTVIEKQGSEYIFATSFPAKKMLEILDRYGKTPLPPYIKNTPLKESAIRREYQTIFAKAGASVAAPTASLHFTKNLITRLKKQGIENAYVNLTVGLGTFASLSDKNLSTGTLHYEAYEIPKQVFAAIKKAKKEKRPVIAVGTTVVRTLESGAQTGKIKGSTNLFIQPGFDFKIVDGIITNFHVPKSSLLMLISAFAGRKIILDLYAKAISKKFRLFSFGDGMLLY